MDTNNSVDTLEDQAWDRTIAVNLTAPVRLMREVVPVMIKNGGGSIVNVASKAGMSGAVAGVAYTASKHGLVSPRLQQMLCSAGANPTHLSKDWGDQECGVEVQRTSNSL